MAEEIEVDLKISCNNGNFKFIKQGTKMNIDQAVVGGAVPGTVTINIAGTSVDLTGMTEQGWVLLRNLDDTNYVTFGGAVDQVGKMKPGEPALFRLNTTMSYLRMVANTANCEVLVRVFED